MKMEDCQSLSAEMEQLHKVLLQILTSLCKAGGGDMICVRAVMDIIGSSHPQPMVKVTVIETQDLLE